MLLIGSRAIVHYFPEFRAPRDWDLYGTAEEIESLAQRLPPMKDKSPGPHKSIFDYDGSMVEVVNIEYSPEWTKIYEAFRNEPSFEEPVLGRLTIAPAAFLMLTKQCGLIYGILHWHKNLEDLYFLRDRIPVVPDIVTQVMPYSLADSRKMFAHSYVQAVWEPQPCHSSDPEHSPLPHSEIHARLHDVLGHGRAPLVLEPGAWQAYPDVEPELRREKMIRLFAEETQVIAAEQLLMRGFGLQSDDERMATRWALRMLITGRLPESWRYFGVNHYREIMAAIPRGWTSHLAELSTRYARPTESCQLPDNFGCDPSPDLAGFCGQGPAAPFAAAPPKVAPLHMTGSSDSRGSHLKSRSILGSAAANAESDASIDHVGVQNRAAATLLNLASGVATVGT